MPESPSARSRWFDARHLMVIPTLQAVAAGSGTPSRFMAAPARPQRPRQPPARIDDMLYALPQGDTLAVEEPLGQEVWCLSGSLWITHDEDGRDIVLRPGKGYVADRRARLLVHALDDARFIVQPFDR